MTSYTPPSFAATNTEISINHLSRQLSEESSILVHKYYALRHGQSLANIAKIISSDPIISTKQHGLSDLGKEQVMKAGEAFAKQYIIESQSSCHGRGNSSNNTHNHVDATTNDGANQGVAIFSSDFLRATETANIFASILRNNNIPIYQNDIILETRLRERYFGELNGGPDTRYQEVWNEDMKDANHLIFGVESANSVLERTTRFIVELDNMLSSSSLSIDGKEQEGTCNRTWKVILVAHGDVLQIVQTGFLLHTDASRHRSLDHLETATVRELILQHDGVGAK